MTLRILFFFASVLFITAGTATAQDDCFLSFQLRVLQRPYCGQATGAAEVFFTDDSDAPAPQVVWSNGTVGARAEQLPAGIYGVTVTDSAGCSRTRSVDVAAAELHLRQEGSFCVDSNTVFLRPFAPPGLTPTAYRWSTGATTERIATPRVGEEYQVTVTYAGGCTLTAGASVWFTYLDTSFLNDTYLIGCDAPSVTLEPTIDVGGRDVRWNEFRYTELTVAPTLTLDQGFDVTATVEGHFPGCIYQDAALVIDHHLDDRELLLRRDSTCYFGNSLRVSNTGYYHIDSITYDWFGPDGPIETGYPAQDYLNQLQPGDYRVVMTSPSCGTRTLTATVGPELRCRNLGGTLYLDQRGDCAATTVDEVPIPRGLVEIVSTTGGGTFYALTDEEGRWERSIAEDSYRIRPLWDLDGSAGDCDPVEVTLADQGVTDVRLRVPVAAACPLIATSLVAPRFRRCFENTLYVNYENRGTGTAEAAVLRLTLDEYFDEVTLDLPFERTGDTLLIELGDVDPFATGRVAVNFTIGCDAVLGQLHCVEAVITPAGPCGPNPEWGGALVSVDEGQCVDGEPVFRIRNVGDAPMSIPLSYIVVEDGIMMTPVPTTGDPLNAGDFVDVRLTPGPGATAIHLAALQEPGAPANPLPAAVVIGCGTDGATGGGNVLTLGDGRPGSSVLCRENTGSYDPNEKLGFPVGFGGSLNEINPDTRLHYELHFQNTGSDTAFTVVIRDTLPVELDLTTVTFGAASHAYTVALDSGRVLRFTFDDILLPDSSANLAGSQGVVNFTILPVADLEPGRRIANRAAIYFDFNAPVITEAMVHHIARKPVEIVSGAGERAFALAGELTLHPNPVSDRLTVNLAGYTGAATLTVYDGLGRPVVRREWSEARPQLDVSGLRPGAYHLTLRTPDGRTSRGKTFVVGR